MPTTNPGLSIVETSKIAFQLVHKNFLFIFTTILICDLCVPLLLYGSGKLLSSQPDALIIFWGTLYDSNSKDIILNSVVWASDIWELVALSVIPAVITVKMIEGYTTGTQRNLSSYLAKACQVLPGLIIVKLISGITITIGAIFLIIPGLIFSAMFSCACPIYIFEGKGIIQSLKNSRKMTWGYKSDIIYFWIVSIILMGTIALPAIAVIIILKLNGSGIGMTVTKSIITGPLATYGFSLNAAIYILLRQKRNKAVEDAASTITESEENTEQISAPLPQQA